MKTNTRVVLKRRPTDTATADCFALITDPLPALEANHVRVAVEYVSVDAGTRTMLRGEGFHQQVPLEGTVRAGGVGRIVESALPDWHVGMPVAGGMGVQQYADVPTDQLQPIPNTDLPIQTYLGALGPSTGITAWIGIHDVAKPVSGETFVVSAAAGAVGCIAGQLAKLAGARVIGIAGGARKINYLLNEIGFDHAIDYKNEDLSQRLMELAPNGIDVFFDNVGGGVLDTVLDQIAMRGRVIICGAVSQYNNMDNVYGPSTYLRLAERQAKMEGFAYFHFMDSIPIAQKALSELLIQGQLKMPEEVLDGIDKYPQALAFMFDGGNLGKLLVKI